MYERQGRYDGPLRILLVEDNPGDARYIREIFQGAEELIERARPPGGGTMAENAVAAVRRSPTVVHASRLADGVDRLADDRFDVVLLDLNLPDSEGLETVQTFRRHTAALPVVVLTGLQDREVGMEALRSGAEEYLVKDEINADLLVRSVYHAIERKAHERELEQHRTLVETVSDGVYALDDESRFVLVNEALASMTGYSRDELLGSHASLVASRGDVATAEELSQSMVEDDRSGATVETTLRTADGRSVPVETNFAPFPLGDDRYGRTGVIRDVAERKARERQLERHRNQLSTLNALNELVQEITHLAIESSTRAEVEQLACERLADSESYLFAWIGELDRNQETVRIRAEAGAEEYLEEITIRADDSDEGQGPTGLAIRTGEVHVTRDIYEDPDYDPWREHAYAHGVRSSAAIPIVHEGSLYGVLNVYSGQRDAFGADERTVVGRLGQVIGHAINAIERKQALMSEEVVEIRFRIENLLDVLGIDATTDGTITFDRSIPLTADTFLLYGTVTEDAIETLHALVEQVDGFESVTVREEDQETRRFELRLTEPPVLSTIAAQGGRVESADVSGGDYQMTVHLPPSADVSHVVDVVQSAYPDTTVVAQRHTSRTPPSATRLEAALTEDLTERQRTTMETAYFAGFFEWPRDASGEDVAESMGVSASTFHQHVRAAQRKLLRALFDESG